MFNIHSILACPVCGAHITKELICEGCGAIYTKKHGVYNLISLSLSGDQDFLWRGEIPEDEAALFPPEEAARYQVIHEHYTACKNEETKTAQAKQEKALYEQLRTVRGVICDFATGSGSMLKDILDYSREVDAIICTDINEFGLMVTRARRCKGCNNVHFIATDGRYLALADNSVDVVTSYAGFGNVPDAKKVATELFRILKPGGRILLRDEFIEKGTRSYELAKGIGLERGMIEEYLMEELRAAGFVDIQADIVAEAVWAENPYDLIPAAGDSQRYYVLVAEKPGVAKRTQKIKQETMGQIIRRLRKECGFTQEELAEQLNVTFQAISKWENDSGMPDISQVVPLAHVFGVSTDILFGTQAQNDDAEAAKIIRWALDKKPTTRENVYATYEELKLGLERYPTNALLLHQCLEKGLALAYPENGEFYDKEHGKDIYRECVRFADLMFKYGKASADVLLRTHMIMVLFHSAYGNTEAAEKHAREFPWRADMIAHTMDGYIAHWKGDFSAENRAMKNSFMMHLEATIDDMVGIARSYGVLG